MLLTLETSPTIVRRHISIVKKEIHFTNCKPCITYVSLSPSPGAASLVNHLSCKAIDSSLGVVTRRQTATACIPKPPDLLRSAPREPPPPPEPPYPLPYPPDMPSPPPPDPAPPHKSMSLAPPPEPIVSSPPHSPSLGSNPNINPPHSTTSPLAVVRNLTGHAGGPLKSSSPIFLLQPEISNLASHSIPSITSPLPRSQSDFSGMLHFSGVAKGLARLAWSSSSVASIVVKDNYLLCGKLGLAHSIFVGVLGPSVLGFLIQ